MIRAATPIRVRVSIAVSALALGAAALSILQGVDASPARVLGFLLLGTAVQILMWAVGIRLYLFGTESFDLAPAATKSERDSDVRVRVAEGSLTVKDVRDSQQEILLGLRMRELLELFRSGQDIHSREVKRRAKALSKTLELSEGHPSISRTANLSEILDVLQHALVAFEDEREAAAVEHLLEAALNQLEDPITSID